jgi:predicted nucleic acid-binding protein
MDLLGAAFPNFEIFITESVSIELLRASQAGFSFPNRIFRNIPVISLNQDERIMQQEIPKNRSIHFGEAEGLIISKNRNAIFLTNDSRVVRYCRDNDLKVLDLEQKDNIIIKDKSSILDKFER